MTTVKRQEHPFGYLWALIRSAYYIIVLPCALIIATITLIIGFGSSYRYSLFSSDYALLALLWMVILIPLVYRRMSINSRRVKLRKIVSMLTSTARFCPHHEILNAAGGKYLGVDTKSGNILYIHLVNKGSVDVIGLTMSDWTNRELEGSMLRLYTKNTDSPVLSITAPPNIAKELFDVLGSMSHNGYSESFPKEPWTLHVGIQSRFVEFEHNVVVPQVQ